MPDEHPSAGSNDAGNGSADTNLAEALAVLMAIAPMDPICLDRHDYFETVERCFFCGVDASERDHEPDCSWVRARILTNQNAREGLPPYRGGTRPG